MSDDATRRGLLQAVLDAPDDDVPRLVYADWLTAHDDPRGDFIRVQCGLRGIGRGERIPLKRREQRLIRAHGAKWRAPATPAMKLIWRRGFIDEVRLYNVGKGLDALEALFDVEPVRYLEVTFATADDMQAFLTSGLVGRLAGLKCTSYRVKGGALLAALLACPGVATLVNLNLSHAGVDAKTAKAIARAPELAGLRVLSLTGCNLGDAGVANLVDAKSLGRWTALYLSSCGVTDEGVAALVDSPVMAGLEYLTLNRNGEIGDEGAARLAASPDVASLQWLELDATSVTDEGARALLASPSLAGLRRISLRRTPFARAPGGALAAMRARWPRGVSV